MLMKARCGARNFHFCQKNAAFKKIEDLREVGMSMSIARQVVAFP